MDWTNSLGDVKGIDDAQRMERRLQTDPAIPAAVEAAIYGLTSGLSFGRSEGTGSSMMRGAHPVAYRVGQYFPAWLAARMGGGPLAAGVGGAALLNEPVVQRYYHDNIEPKPYLVPNKLGE